MMQQAFSFQGNAVVGVLAFLGTCFALLVGVITAIYLLAAKKIHFAKVFLLFMTAGVGLYVATLFAFSLTGREVILDARNGKDFGDAGQHLVYSVEDAQCAQTLGVSSSAVTAAGKFYLITLKAISAGRGVSRNPGGLRPMPDLQVFIVMDGQGRTYTESKAGENAFREEVDSGEPSIQPLRLGDSFETLLVFDLPRDIQTPRLLITSPEGATTLMIKTPNDLLHQDQ